MRSVTRRALRNGFTSAAAETVAHSLSKQFGSLLGKYVDPKSFCFNEARGYWAHNNQDVKRIDGHFRAPELYTFESWDHTLSDFAKSGCHIVDVRGTRGEDSMFILEKGKQPKAA